MKYLFFDIECSNSFNGTSKMCEFGYVITDENFNIISSDDIPMCPGKGCEDRFHLRRNFKGHNISLAYEEEYYMEQPELPVFYKTIKNIIEDKETICFAFSMNNDIRYLADSCKKYNLPILNYTCYDIQKIAGKYLGVDSPGLKKCIDVIVGPHAGINLIEHLSRDDAKMEMMVMEAICFLRQIGSKTLLEESDFAKVNSIEFIKEIQKKKELKTIKKNIIEYLKEKSEEDLVLINEEKYIGKRYGISSKTFSNINQYEKTIKLIHNIGGVFTTKKEVTDFLIVENDEELKLLHKILNDSFGGEIILLDDFYKKYNS